MSDWWATIIEVEWWVFILALFVANGTVGGYGYYLGRRDPIYRGKHRR